MKRAVRVGKSLDGHDFSTAHGVREDGAGVMRYVIQQDSARTALGTITAELRASEPKLVAQRPGQRFLLHDIDPAGLAVHVESNKTPAHARRLLTEERRSSKQIRRR